MNSAIIRSCWERPRVQQWARKAPAALQFLAWHCVGRPVPAPSAVKQRTVRWYARQYGLKTLIETGTFLGDLIEATKGSFDEIYSIELDRALHERATARFVRHRHIHLLQGDSGLVLPALLKRVTAPCLFWLDGHWSGGITARCEKDTPILAETKAILEHPCKEHVILVDDARCFDGLGDYPSVQDVRDLFLAGNPGMTFEIRDDIMRICPRKVRSG